MKTPLAKLILSVLVNEFQSKGRFLSVPMIAQEVFGIGYRKNTALDCIATIKQNMGHVRQLADSNGMLIIPLRKQIKANEDRGKIIVGWKVAGVMDSDYIEKEFLNKIQNGKARYNSAKRFIGSADNKQLIRPEKYKELAEINFQEP